MWLKADLKTFDMSVGGPLGAKFDVIYIDPVSHRHPPHTVFPVEIQVYSAAGPLHGALESLDNVPPHRNPTQPHHA